MIERKDGRGPWKADFENMLEVAATHGHLEIVKWLYERGIDWHTLWEINKSAPEYPEESWLYEHCSSKALMLAAEHGHLDVVQWIYKTRTDTCTTYCKPINRAVVKGHLAIAKWLYNVDGQGSSNRAVDEAAANGHLQMLQWLDANHLIHSTTAAIDGAARNGHLQVVQWLHQTFGEIGLFPSNALVAAANYGHFEVVEWVHENMLNTSDRYICYCGAFAARYGHFRVLQWLYKHFPHTFYEIQMDDPADKGHLEITKWLHEHPNGGCTKMASLRAASIGILELVQWFHAHYPNTFVPQAMDRAAENGHLEVVRWLHENRREGCTRSAMAFAARKGHLDIVLFLLENRNEGFSRDAMVAAQDIEVRCFFDWSHSHRSNDSRSEVRRGHLSLLRAAFSRKPDFIRGCMRCLTEIAVREGNVEILDWLNHFGLELRTTVPIRNAVSRGDVKLLQWFHQNGFEVLDPDLLELAVQNNQLDVARWLSKHGYTICLKSVQVAGRNHNFPLVRWLVEHGPPLDFAVVKALVMESCHVEIGAWVSEPDRVQLVLEVLQTEDRELLWWILTRTRFESQDSRCSIRDAIQRAPEGILLWIQKSFAGLEICRWCCTTTWKRRSGEVDAVAAGFKKAKRCDEV